jgi:hypothetical protein
LRSSSVSSLGWVGDVFIVRRFLLNNIDNWPSASTNDSGSIWAAAMSDPLAEFAALPLADRKAVERRLTSSSRQVLRTALEQRERLKRPAVLDLAPYSSWLRDELSRCLTGEGVTLATRTLLRAELAQRDRP